MTERLFHEGVRGTLWHDREGGRYIVNIVGHAAVRIEARSYDAAVADFTAAAEQIACAGEEDEAA